MQIIIIVAYALPFRYIGKDLEMLWRLPKDFQNFKKETLHHTVSMGRKTFESLPGQKPLIDRENHIITRDVMYRPEHANDQTKIFHSLKESVLHAERSGCEKYFIAGGGEIYAQALTQTDFEITKILATEVHLGIDSPVTGNVFFPKITKFPVHRRVLAEHAPDEKHAHAFTFVEYVPM